MPVAFGWSAGDIVRAISILNTVYHALQDSGGAACEYQSLKCSIESYILILKHLEALKPEEVDRSLVQAVQTLSAVALEAVFEFENEIHKYNSALCQTSTVNRAQSGVRKVQYALRVPKRLAKLKADLEMPIGRIQVLLESEGLKQSGRVIASLKRMQSSQKDIKTELRSDIQSSQYDTKMELKTEIEKQVDSVKTEIEKQGHEVIAKFNQALADMAGNIVTLIQPVVTSTTTDVNPVGSSQIPMPGNARSSENSLKVGNQGRCALSLSTQLADLSLDSTTLPAPYAPELGPRLPPNLELSEALKKTGHELLLLLLQLVTSITALLRYLISISPQLLAVFRTLYANLPTRNRLLIQDKIHFEDFLGRVHHLPYEYFHYWNMFDFYLKILFKHQTGEQLIEQGAFHIMHATRGWLIGKQDSDWSRSIRPGSRIAMSAVLYAPPPREIEACPRCDKRLQAAQGTVPRLICKGCAWERYIGHPSGASARYEPPSDFKRVHMVEPPPPPPSTGGTTVRYCANCGDGPQGMIVRGCPKCGHSRVWSFQGLPLHS